MLIVGAAGGLLGGLAMNVFTRLAAKATNGREAEGAAYGSRRIGRGMQPPQAVRRADDDAATRVGSAAFEAITGRSPDRALRLRLGRMAHYAFSAAAGASYVVISSRIPVLRRGFGGAYAALLWASADEGAMPALGLSRGPTELSPGLHAYSLIGHWIYAATLESVRRFGLDRSAKFQAL